MGNNLAVLRLLRKPHFKEESVICITGASDGIGKELALQYAIRKCKLFLGARSIDKLEKVTKLCRSLGSECDYTRCDVTKEEDCQHLIESCVQKYGTLDILILNAGVNAHIRFDEIQDLSIFHKVMQTNFFGYLYCTKHAMPYLKKTKGQIIVISSMSGEIGLPFRSAYCSSKFAVTGFFESLRIELENNEVDITLVCPPSVKTDMRDHDLLKSDKIQHDDEEDDDKRMSVEVNIFE